MYIISIGDSSSRSYISRNECSSSRISSRSNNSSLFHTIFSYRCMFWKRFSTIVSLIRNVSSSNVTFAGFLWRCINSLPSAITSWKIRSRHPHIVPHVEIPKRRKLIIGNIPIALYCRRTTFHM